MSEKLFPKSHTHPCGLRHGQDCVDGVMGTCLSIWKEGNDAPKANIGGCEGLSGSPGGSGTEQGQQQPGDKPISPLYPIMGGKATLLFMEVNLG